MEKHINYQTKTGLRITYVQKPQFQRSYCGIGCKYGSAHLFYIRNQKEMVLPAGLAHFLEHKLFAMPDGSDAFSGFTAMNATANAYTTTDKTLYFFTTTDRIWDPLSLLLNMYFTPHFTEEAVEHEKDIICSEIKMYEDKADAAIVQKLMEALYPDDSLSCPIAGTKQSVLKTTAEDLNNAYETFYHPQNSHLVIVSKEDPKPIFDQIERLMDSFCFLPIDFQKKQTVLSDHVIDSVTIHGKTSQTQAWVALRMDSARTVPLFCHLMIGILDCLFSPLAAFYQKLSKQKAFLADIDYTVVTQEETAYLILSAITNHPEDFIKQVTEKIKTVQIEDLDEQILDLYLKHLKAKQISQLDSIENLGDEILSLALEEIDYFAEQKQIALLKTEDFKPYLSYLHEASIVQAISYKKS